MNKSMPAACHKVGTQVKWNWMGLLLTGTIKKIFLKRVSQTLDGSVFTRNGSPEKPAYLVKTAKGRLVIKSHGELQK